MRQIALNDRERPFDDPALRAQPKPRTTPDMIPAPKGWKAAYVTFFALLAIFIPGVSVWTRGAFDGDAPDTVKIAAVGLVVALSAAAALLVRRLLRL